jgi:DNA-binding IclR family transcriptional regulator
MELARDISESQPLQRRCRVVGESWHETGESLFSTLRRGSKRVFWIWSNRRRIFALSLRSASACRSITAAGKAILAQYSPSERAATLSRINYQSYEQDAFMTADAVESDIQKSGNDGWYVNLARYQPGVAGIAVPFAFRGRRNAIALGGPISRIENRIDAIGRLLRESVERFLNDNE